MQKELANYYLCVTSIVVTFSRMPDLKVVPPFVKAKVKVAGLTPILCLHSFLAYNSAIVTV